MSFIKPLQKIKKLIPFNWGKSVITWLQKNFTSIYVHHSVKIYGVGSLDIENGVHLDEGTIIYLHKKSNLKISNNTRIGRNCYLEIGEDQIIFIGNNSSIQNNCHLHGNVHIGNSTLIAPNCYMSSGTHMYAGDRTKTIREKDKEMSSNDKRVIIGNDCWIGINVVILPGSEVGSKCVIGANIVLNGLIENEMVLKNSSSYKIEKIRYI